MKNINSEKGVAVVLVMLVIALASILVVDLTYSTFLSSRTNSMAQRSLQAEYILKSAVNFARVLIQQDETPEDSTHDLWGKFSSGVAIPPSLLGFEELNVDIQIEIRPEDAKIPLRALVPNSSLGPNLRWRKVFSRLFELAKFDEDEQEDHTGFFRGRVFTGDELVSAIIDYMDADTDSYDPGDFAAGIESAGGLPDEYFPNRRVNRVGELISIPGFTPSRLRKVSPFLHSFGKSRININLAPRMILQSLHDEIGPEEADLIIQYRSGESGPYTSANQSQALRNILGDTVYQEVSLLIDTQSGWFQVVAKVDYGTARYFIRAYISRQQGRQELPEIQSIELY